MNAERGGGGGAPKPCMGQGDNDEERRRVAVPSRSIIMTTPSRARPERACGPAQSGSGGLRRECCYSLEGQEYSIILLRKRLPRMNGYKFIVRLTL